MKCVYLHWLLCVHVFAVWMPRARKFSRELEWMDNLHGKNPDDIPFMTPGSYLLKSIRFYTPALAFLAWEAHMERKKDLNRMQLLEKEKITNGSLSFLYK